MPAILLLAPPPSFWTMRRLCFALRQTLILSLYVLYQFHQWKWWVVWIEDIQNLQGSHPNYSEIFRYFQLLPILGPETRLEKICSLRLIGLNGIRLELKVLPEPHLRCEDPTLMSQFHDPDIALKKPK